MPVLVPQAGSPDRTKVLKLGNGTRTWTVSVWEKLSKNGESNFHRSGRPTKITSWGHEPRTTSKAPQDSHVSVNITVHDPKIRKRLGVKMASIGEFQGRTKRWAKKNNYQTTTWWTPRLLVNVFCGMSRENFNFLEGVRPATSGVKLTNIRKRSYQRSNMVVLVWWSEAALRFRTWMNHLSISLN